MLTARGIAAVSQCCQGCLAACRSLGRVGALGRCLAGWKRMAVALVFDDLERFLLWWYPIQTYSTLDSAQATTLATPLERALLRVYILLRVLHE